MLYVATVCSPKMCFAFVKYSTLTVSMVSVCPLLSQREAAERQTEVERRHLEARLSYEEALIARESHLRDVHRRAQAMKKEVHSLTHSTYNLAGI